MSEKSLWAALRKGMQWDEATRHEDCAALGVADVSFCTGAHHGWLELKHVVEWPVREATPLRIPHFTDDQRHFLRQKQRYGGHTWLLVQVGRCYLLYSAAQDLDGLGTTWTQQQARLAARRIWAPRLNYDELLACLALTND